MLLCAAATLGGCRFWYKPVPVANAIGEERAVVAGDTLNVYRSDRFEVYAHGAESVYDGYEQLNRAYRQFERYFGAPAPRLAFLLRTDTAPPLDEPTLKTFRDRGFVAVQYWRPHGVRTRRSSNVLDYGGILWPVAPTAARHMFARFTATQVDGGASASDDALLARYPLWIRAAVIHLVGEAAAAGSSSDLDLLKEKRAQLVPFPTLLTLVRPAAADTLLDPSRRSEADENTRIVAAESAMLARYLIEREGAGVLARLVHGYLTHRSLSDMMSEFRSAPKTVSSLEDRWKVWLDTREPD